MSTAVRIHIGDLVLDGSIEDTGTAAALLASLPLEFEMSRWGDEYYGDIGLGASGDEPMIELVEVGDLAYWPPGDALCVFFGPTPASEGDQPRAASPVSVIGRIEVDPAALRSLPDVVVARLEIA
jgi:hypothetical protein